VKEWRRILVRRAVGVVVLLGLTMLRLLTDLGLDPDVATELYLLSVTGVVLLWCFQVLAGLPASDPLWSRADRRSQQQGRPDRLEVLDEMFTFWIRTSYTRHRRLRPAVRALIATRLKRSNIDLDTDPRAPRLLGPQTWELVRPDAPPPSDEDSVGLTARQVDEIARTLTALSRPDFIRTAQTGEQH
jgi:hypothetical protein